MFISHITGDKYRRSHPTIKVERDTVYSLEITTMNAENNSA